jgi:hypothetical protein
MLGAKPIGAIFTAAVFWSAPRAAEPTQKPTVSNSAASRSSPAPAAKGSQAPRSGRDAAQRSPQLLCQPEHDVEIGVMNRRFQKELPKGFDEIRERARQALSPLKPADDNDDPSRTS